MLLMSLSYFIKLFQIYFIQKHLTTKPNNSNITPQLTIWPHAQRNASSVSTTSPTTTPHTTFTSSIHPSLLKVVYLSYKIK